MARDDYDVVLRLEWKLAAPCKKVCEAGRASVVCGGCEAQIAEPCLEIGEQRSGLWDCGFWIERVLEPAIVSSARHELRYAQCACRTDGVRFKSAFLPYQPGQKRDGKAFRESRGINQPAHGRDERFPIARRCADLIRQG